VRALNWIGSASVALMKLFSCQFGLDCHSFRHAFIIHPLNGFDMNKLKYIKRSMYGRGSFELLRQRVLQAA
jgi:transposase